MGFVQMAQPWPIDINFERMFLLSWKKKTKPAPSFAIKNIIFKYYVAKPKNKRISRSISYNMIVWFLSSVLTLRANPCKHVESCLRMLTKAGSDLTITANK